MTKRNKRTLADIQYSIKVSPLGVYQVWRKVGKQETEFIYQYAERRLAETFVAIMEGRA